MDVAEALGARVSQQQYEPAEMSLAEVEALVALAQEAPSSYNIQFTRFVAVRSPEAKASLRPAANGQPKVEAAAVVFVLLGDLRAHEAYADRQRAAAEAGKITAELAERLASSTQRIYGDARMLRDECCRSVGLSGMALMLAAQSRGWSSCPMIGFDPVKVSEVLGLDEQLVPLMLVAVGKGAGEQRRKPRLPASAVLTTR